MLDGGTGNDEIKIMRPLARRFLADQTGASAVEYAAVACFVSIVIVTIVTGIGGKVKDSYDSAHAAMN